MQRIAQYFRDTANEMKHVKWPTQRQATVYTSLVITVCLVVGLFVGAFDYIFTQGIQIILNSFY